MHMKTLLISLVAGMSMLGAPSLTLAGEPGAAYRALPNFELAVGEAFPLDGLLDANGRAIARERLLGKPVLINFYTRHCAPCIKEVPKLNEVMKRRGELKVLAITPDPAAEAAKYVKRHGLKWPVAADAEVLLFNRLNVQAFPAFALLDDKGRLIAAVQANQLGGEDGHATVAGIERWLDVQLAPVRK